MKRPKKPKAPVKTFTKQVQPFKRAYQTGTSVSLQDLVEAASAEGLGLADVQVRLWSDVDYLGGDFVDLDDILVTQGLYLHSESESENPNYEADMREYKLAMASEDALALYNEHRNKSRRSNTEKKIKDLEAEANRLRKGLK